MIIGIGNDIIDVRRIEKTLAKSHGELFKSRVFSENEISYCGKMAASAPHFAARWALKEAFYKALPQDLQPISHWQAIELIRDNGVKPSISILDHRLSELFVQRKITIFHSISHEKEFCTAVVILEQHS